MANAFDQFDQAPAGGGNAFDQFDAQSASGSSGGGSSGLWNSGVDAAKQLPTGIISGVSQLPSVGPRIMGAVGSYLEPKFDAAVSAVAPGLATEMRRQEAMRDSANWPAAPSLTKSLGLSDPTTTAGQYARTVGEFAPGAIAGPGNLATRVATQDVLPAVASEAAGQATVGTKAEPWARVGAAILGGFPFGRWRSTAPTMASPAPLVDDLYDAGRDAYRQVRESGFALKPQPVAALADQVEQSLTAKGLTARNVPETYGVIQDLQDLRNAQPQVDPVTGQWVRPQVTASDFDSARQELLQASRNQSNRREAAAAWDAIGKMDDYLANVPQAHVAQGDAQTASELFDFARGNWAAAKRLEMASGKVELGNLNAETAHSGMNIDNAMRQAVKQLIRPNKYGKTLAEQHGFSDDEMGLMNDIARGTGTTNTLRYVGNLLGGGGGFGQLAMAGIGLGGAYETGRPELLALPALGAAARYGAGMATRRQAQNMLDTIARRSPLAQEGAMIPGAAGNPNALLASGAYRGAMAAPSQGLPALPNFSQLQGTSPAGAQDNQRQRGGRRNDEPNRNGQAKGQFAHGGAIPRLPGRKQRADGVLRRHGITP